MSTVLESTPAEEVTPPAARAPGFAITGETVAYIVIAVGAALLRLLDLGATPLSDAESYHALAALRAVDSGVAGPALPPASPALFAGQALTFGLLGADDLTARLPVALAGVALALLPILWRRQIGVLNALGFSLLLTLSPAAIAAARNTDGATLTACLAMLAVWLFGRAFAPGAGTAWRVALGVVVAAMLLLVEPGGPLMGLAMAGGLLLLAWTGNSAAIGETLRAFPWKETLVAAAVAVVVVATVFLLYPAGLGAVGSVLGGFVEGIIARPAGQGFALPFLTFLLYEPLVWIFGAWGLVSALRAGDPTARFLAGWALTGLFLLIFYPGARPAHGLLAVLPMACLAVRAVAPRIFYSAGDDEDESEGGEDETDGAWEVSPQMPGWAKWGYVAGIMALSAAAYLNLMLVGRAIALSGGEDSLVLISRFLFAGMVVLMLVILFFIAGASWGSRAAARGMLQGLVLVLGLYTLSGGAALGFYHADEPRELWYRERPTPQLRLLAEVVGEGSMRAEGSPVTAPVMAQIPPDGAEAWALRAIKSLVFIDAPSAHVNAPVVMLPDASGGDADETPVLGDDYVGMPMVTRRTWDPATVGPEGLLLWVLQREALARPQPAERYVVWLRTDVYGIVKDAAAAE
ncbi:MAG: hypothetical protein JXB47_12200 [Anaerolineae bacterium]|nr:hypothetical protein [Anaerolineae bacterium]